MKDVVDQVSWDQDMFTVAADTIKAVEKRGILTPFFEFLEGARGGGSHREKLQRLRETCGVVSLTVPAFDSESYGRAIDRKFGKLNFETLDTTGAFCQSVQLWSVFVPQSVRQCDGYNPRWLAIPKEQKNRLVDREDLSAEEIAQGEARNDRLRQMYLKQPRRSVLDIVDEALQRSAESDRRLAILGDPGAGKSSLVRYLALRWAGIADRITRNNQPVPLVIDLYSYARWSCDGRKSFIRFLENSQGWYTWSPGALESLLAQPARVLVMLDGLDEIFDKNIKTDVVNDILRFSQDHPRAAVLLTSRVVGYHSHDLRGAGFQHFEVQDLDRDQAADFLRRWHKSTSDAAIDNLEKRDRLLMAIHHSQSLGMLAGNPLLLTMIAILNRDPTLPQDRSELYERASSLLLHHWDVERTLPDSLSQEAAITAREKSQILQRVATFIRESPGGLKGNSIEGAELIRMIAEFVGTELKLERPRVVAEAVVERLWRRNFILCSVGTDRYGFVHRSFLEYFCSVDLVHHFNTERILSSELVDTLLRHREDEEWREVSRLVCNQIGKTHEAFVDAFVRRLITNVSIPLWNRFSPLPELELALCCLSEIRDVNRLASEVHDLFDKVIEAGLRLHPSADDAVLAGVLQIASEIRWPDKAVLADRLQRAISGQRLVSPFLARMLTSLAESREELLALLNQRTPSDVYTAVCESLVRRWPDNATRSFLALLLENQSPLVRKTAATLLFETWPDDDTRSRLKKLGRQDENSDIRSMAISALSTAWPDDVTRSFLSERANQDPNSDVQITAISSLTSRWPDETTRSFLTEEVLQDLSSLVRAMVVSSLAETWPDESTRSLLAERIVHDWSSLVQRNALSLLVKKWPDGRTRALLTGETLLLKSADLREAVVSTLITCWPDDDTRLFLTMKALQNKNLDIKRSALDGLVMKWPDEETLGILSDICRANKNAHVRGFAVCRLAALDSNSKVGRFFFSSEIDGKSPFIDPLGRVSRTHLEKCARRLQMSDEELGKELESLSKFLGWHPAEGLPITPLAEVSS